MNFPRRAGILLHPTSLPGDFGIGDLGPHAYSFVDFLVESGQTYWQILPLGPTGYGDSPYNCYSAFAGNTLLISPEKLIEDGLLEKGQLNDRPHFTGHRVDYGAVIEWKSGILSNAFQRFRLANKGELHRQFEIFQQENGWWLEDYALYQAIRSAKGHSAWYDWPEPLKLRDAAALAEASGDERTLEQKFLQFLFFQQWSELKGYASLRGIHIVGDIPIFVALDSADVWCNQDKFKLEADGSPTVVSGVPPDYFSPTGQLWGNPIYDWDAMRKDDFGWWTARFAFMLRMVDVIRVDHFRGFAALWEVPGTDKTAENGRWVEAPGREIFTTLRQRLGEIPVIAEDLGVITPEVDELRESFGFPGMKILQFAFGGDAQNQYLPHNYDRNCVVYTGNHDNDTTIGWWRSHAGKRKSPRKAASMSPVHEHCRNYLNTDGSEIHWDIIRAAFASTAHTAIVPLQDVLGIGNEGRMNLPASTSGNWAWRYQASALTTKIKERLKELSVLYGRT